MGDELLNTIKEEEKKHNEEIDKPEIEKETIESNSEPEPIIQKQDDYAGEIRDGVEVINVKAIPKKQGKIDKYGIPIGPNELKNFDSII